jgi:hypothetical protein
MFHVPYQRVPNRKVWMTWTSNLRKLDEGVIGGRLSRDFLVHPRIRQGEHQRYNSRTHDAVQRANVQMCYMLQITTTSLCCSNSLFTCEQELHNFDR